jgi:integrative and conjugative element protein (TIGR02256 family)
MSGMQQDLVFRNPANDGFVIVTAAVLRQVTKHRQTAGHHQEAGGILLGSRRGRHIEITFATTPKRGDKRSRTAFHRLSLFHQRFATRAWLRLGRTLDYLGEWHTHPERDPSPSLIDRGEWTKLVRSNKRELVFLILGISGVWIGLSNSGVVRELPSYRASFGERP